MKTPVAIFRTLDDTQVKAILIQHGRSEAAEPLPGYPAPFRHHVTWDVGGVFYLVTRWIGYSNPADNGYRAIWFPMLGLTLEECKEFSEWLAREGASGPDYYNIDEWKRVDCN